MPPKQRRGRPPKRQGPLPPPTVRVGEQAGLTLKSPYAAPVQLKSPTAELRVEESHSPRNREQRETGRGPLESNEDEDAYASNVAEAPIPRFAGLDFNSGGVGLHFDELTASDTR